MFYVIVEHDVSLGESLCVIHSDTIIPSSATKNAYPFTIDVTLQILACCNHVSISLHSFTHTYELFVHHS